MKRYSLLTMIFLVALCVQAQVTYQRQDSLTICRLLQSATPQTSVLTLARHFLGVPYVAHTLEVNVDASQPVERDERLVVNTRQLDCTTLVETVVALKLCAQQGKRTWNDYTSVLRRLRYRGGVLDGYASRLHYFSDWISDKRAMQLVQEIQRPNPPFTAVQKIAVSYMSKHPQAYRALKAHPGLVPLIRRQEQSLTGQTARYIPKKEVKNTELMRQTVKDGDIIAITCNKAGLDIAHLGFAVWRSDGLHLLNASQLHHKVVEEPMTLRNYLSKHSTFTGIRIVRLRNL